MSTERRSVHVDPHGSLAIARHYIRDLVYGANDGVITTFAVVAGVTGGSLTPVAVLVVGAANLAADGIAMGVGNTLSIRAHEKAREADGLPEEEAHPWKHGAATFIAFVTAGVIPLLPYVFGGSALPRRFAWSIGLTAGSLFTVGIARAAVTRDRWWTSGVEMLLLGGLVAVAAYGAGALVKAVAP